jgi:hypothetical protein
VKPTVVESATVKDERTPVVFAAGIAGLLLLVLVANYVLVFDNVRRATHRAGTDLPSYWAKDGTAVTTGMSASLRPAINPLHVWRASRFGLLLVLASAAAVVYTWHRMGALERESPLPVVWLSGVLLPPIIGLAWFPLAFLRFVDALKTAGLSSQEIFGAGIGEALSSTVTGLELSLLLLGAFVVIRTRRHARGPSPNPSLQRTPPG